jgi:hypothetical protein
VSVGASRELVWHKSSACFPSECVEVATCGNMILVRDSADTAGPVLRIPRREWQMFVNRIATSCRSPYYPDQ